MVLKASILFNSHDSLILFGFFAVVFNPDNAQHLGFIISTASLKAEMYGVSRTLSPSEVHAYVGKLEMPPFAPRHGLKIAVTDAEQQAEHPGGEEGRVEEILPSLPTPASLQGPWNCETCQLCF